MQSLKRSLVLFVTAAAVYGGFVYGRTLGTNGHEFRRGVREIARMLTSRFSAPGGEFQGVDPSVPPADVFESVLDHVQHEFVEGDASKNNARLANGALQRMYASLNDPRTDYLDPALRAAREDALRGRYHGIGAALAITRSKKLDVEYQYLTIVDVVPGSPAERAGLRTGDHITEINGHWIIAYSPRSDVERIQNEKKSDQAKEDELKTLSDRFLKGYSLIKALPRLAEGEGARLQLGIDRAGSAAPISASLTTAVTPVPPVTFRTLAGGAAWIAVHQFNPEAARAVAAGLAKAPGLKAVILDLRGNPGGVRADASLGVDGFDAAQKIIALLSPGGTVAQLEMHPKQRVPLKVNGAARPVPVAVLVDGGTANLSELVAAVLRDSAHAHVLGAKTFGDSDLLLFAALKNGGAVEITNAHMLTLRGVDLKEGIEPDIAVSTGPDPDIAVRRALASLGA